MMDIPISQTKIALPARRAEWLTRPRLLELFYDLLAYKLILVTAPAGYGKTTFMADVAQQVDIPTCWFSLDELDQDLPRFIYHFIGAIEARFPGFGGLTRASLRSHAQINLDHLITILTNEVYSQIREHFLIVLDDYYFVEVNPEVREFISLFIQRTDENCHLALLTRKLPDLPDLTLLVGRTQVGGLSFRELAFTPDEIKGFIQQNYHQDISEITAQELYTQTEGWITGLLLSAQSQWSQTANKLRVARVSGIDLSAYLMEQVLKQQPDYLCRFLLQSSLLEQFNGPFCEMVLETPPNGHSWQELIFTVLEKNLFIQPLENGWVRYHHLFRDFLQAQIAERYPNEYRRVLNKLAEVYMKQGEWEKSRTIYQRLDNQAAIAQLIEEVSASFAAVSRYKTLANWIDELPHALRFSNPAMLSLRGITAVMLGNVADGIEFLNQATHLFREVNQPKGLAQTLMRRGMAFFMAGDFQRGLADAQEALQIEETPEITQAESLRVVGLCYQKLGEFQSAAQYLERARLKFVFLGDQRREAIILSDLGMLYRALGKYDQAETAYINALNFWKSVQEFSRAAFTANNLGVFYQFRGDYKKAATCLEEALTFAKQSGDAKGLAYTSLGDLYADLKIFEAARAAYSAARTHANRLNDKFLMFYLDLAEAQLAFSQGGEEYAYPLLASAKRAILQRASAYQKGLLELTTAQIILVNHPEQAKEALGLALNYFSEQAHSNENLLSHFYMAIVKLKLSLADLASQHLTKTLQLAQELGNPQPLIIAASHHFSLVEKIPVPTHVTYQYHALIDKVQEFNRQLPALRRSLRKQELSIPVDPPKIVIRGLGTNQVFINGKEISSSDWQTARARDVFFFILEHPGGVSREKIELAFWPEASSSQLNFIFKKTMYRLRRAFENDPIIFNSDRYTFDFKGDYEYDVEEWERALKQAERATQESDQIAFLSTAVSIYKGIFLPDIDGDWVIEKREYFNRKYFEANLILGKWHLAQGDHTKVLSFSQTLLSLDPGFEEAHRLAMRAHAARGNRAEVVRQYNHCIKTLKKEYGIAPSKETTKLYHALTK
ncbi:MAG: hypothetical protein Fur0022_35500 [Anaerolineales bacterium]